MKSGLLSFCSRLFGKALSAFPVCFLAFASHFIIDAFSHHHFAFLLPIKTGYAGEDVCTNLIESLIAPPISIPIVQCNASPHDLISWITS